ncbi:MAG: hypothetical protein HUU20_17445 [Pirellulales bacterium]|nr:hypothetical protein [Pirellulales bacterium]
MTKNKWIKRLRREITANPKKAAILGLLLLVAVYFWLPLVWGWVSEGGTTASVPSPGAEEQPLLPAAVAPQPSGEASSPAIPAYPWQQLVQWMNADLRAVSSDKLGALRDPFHTLGLLVAEREEEPEAAASKPPVVWTPESLGLQVSSTVAGPARGVALINGRIYEAGETIDVSKNGQTMTLTLAEVHPGRIILQSGQERFELAIPQRAISGRIELVGSRE